MQRSAHLLVLALLLTAGLAMGGCPQEFNPGGSSDNGTGGDGGSGGDSQGGNVSQSALSYNGALSGSARTVSSTDAATSGSGAGFAAPAADELGGATGWFEDLAGGRLRDADGNEYPMFPVAADGSFSVDSLPVGVDIVLKIDTDGDGVADIETIVNIPKDPGSSDAGSLDGVTADPLSTLILAKFQRLLEARGIDPKRLRLSPSALIQRIRDAYEHLFADSGIEDQIDLSQIANLSDEDLARLFEELIPSSARRGMEMAEGNMDLEAATDVAAVVKAICKILVQGGFVIADDPGGADLSELGNLPNVTSMTFEEWNNQMNQHSGEQPPGFDFPQPRLYFSELGEVDRNFANNQEQMQGRGRGPWYSEHMLLKMAQQFLDKKTISLADLYRVFVDVDLGMGARLAYFKWNGPGLPPSQVFETTDGAGLERNMDEFRRQVEQMHMERPDPQLFQQQQAQLRQILAEFLSGTAEPAFERVFGGLLMDRIGSSQEFAQQVRDAQAHLPFSRSGPASFFVLATADSFRDPEARPVTVDVSTDDKRQATAVTYNTGGEGKYYVGFGPQTDNGMIVSLVHRRTGRMLHDNVGRPQELQLQGNPIFQDVGGVSFAAAFSESGDFFPGAPALRTPNPGYDPNRPPDPQTNPPVFEAFVLMTEPGPNGTPVRVNYESGVATYSEAGRYYLLFNEHTQTDGTFALISEMGELLMETPGDYNTRILIPASDVQGITLAAQHFTHVFGVDAPNLGYDPSGAPYYDDITSNDVVDANEPSFDHRDFLFNPDDWHSTRVEYYYRRADNGGFPTQQEIDWGAPTPKLRNGVDLVPRNLKPRLNAFRFGRPSVTINLLTAFAPPEFFNGTAAMNADTRVNPFMAIAILNLAMDAIQNVQGQIDWDGPQGGSPPHSELIDARFFTMPIGDPMEMVSQGFEALAH